MKITLVAPALTSLFVLLAGACGHTTDATDDSVAGDDAPRRAPAAQPSPAAKAVAKPTSARAEPAAQQAKVEGDTEHCNQAEEQEDLEIVDVRVGAAPVRGSDRAPVTIVVFTDFQCPFCAKSEATMHELAAKYGDRVRIAFKNNPLPFHDHARLASRAALAAGEQGKFWEYHDVLFAHQNALGREALLAYARELGLNPTKFREAMDADRTAAAVDADIAEAKRLSVMGTPSFFVNGRRVVGAQPLARFESLIDEALVTRR